MVMGKAYHTSIRRQIRKSAGGFVAIVAIITLGVGFLVGVFSATPDMKYTMNRYYAENRAADIDVKATMGLTNTDLAAIATMSDIEHVMPAFVTDTLMSTSDKQTLVSRIYGLPLDQNDGSGFINHLTLVKGRMPQDDSECVIQKPAGYLSDIAIGTTLTVSSENTDYKNVGNIYRTTAYTIVGIVTNPTYFSVDREPSTIGNGRLGAILYVNKSCYALSTYTDFYITVKGAEDLDAFSDEYKNDVADVTAKIKSASEELVTLRYNDIVGEATKKLNKAKSEYADAKAKADADLAEALQKLKNGMAQIRDNEAKLASAEQKLADGTRTLAAARKTLADSKAQLDAAKEGVEQAKAALATGATLPAETLAKIAAYDTGLAKYNSGIELLAQQDAKLQASSVAIANGETELAKAKTVLADGEATYERARLQADQKFAQADQKIGDAEKSIASIEKPRWYVLDRNSNVSYATYKVDVQKVTDVARVFPIFFFLVAALVSLTTMTRMVEEDRTLIGTLKSLGYSSGAITYRYLVYCGMATLIGCVIGFLGGFKLLPSVINRAYTTIYDLPPLITRFNPVLTAIACLLEIPCTIGATLVVCHQTLKERPASLVLPRVPKAGQRILLEKIGFIWKRLPFSYKATARNVFRYKRHLFMTVIGIAGCTALILTGLGLKDSMSNVANTQFKDILLYDLKIETTKDASSSSILNSLLADESHLVLHSETGTMKNGTTTVSTTVYVPKTAAALGEFIHLEDRTSGEPITFTDTSVVITGKMADVLGVKVGDSITLENAKDQQGRFTVTGLTENYLGSYAYINATAYRKAYGDFDDNTILVKSTITDTKAQDRTIAALLQSNAVSIAEFKTQTETSYDNLLRSMNYIVLILIVAAGSLAVTVLYNLTNINIEERTKELATLRVLGYRHNEVANYVFRETAILSVLGVVAGLVLGVALHRYVVIGAETTDLVLSRNVSLWSYVFAAALTLLFTGVVDALMTPKLRRIRMVESMKAAE
ncbi:MAG: FtsX-like permease family protein [Candidatus Cryosericum sp.]